MRYPGKTLQEQLSILCSNWEEQQPDFTTVVKGTRIGANGQKLDGNGVIISGPNQPVAYEKTSVAWDGTNWSGDPAPNGVYHVKVDNVDTLGSVTTATQQAIVRWNQKHLDSVSSQRAWVQVCDAFKAFVDRIGEAVAPGSE